jgi:hypothetical protein
MSTSSAAEVLSSASNSAPPTVRLNSAIASPHSPKLSRRVPGSVNGIWDHQRWNPPALPNHQIIDDACGDHPALLWRLKLAGIGSWRFWLINRFLIEYLHFSAGDHKLTAVPARSWGF